MADGNAATLFDTALILHSQNSRLISPSLRDSHTVARPSTERDFAPKRYRTRPQFRRGGGVGHHVPEHCAHPEVVCRPA
jgi:hypothetical protein